MPQIHPTAIVAPGATLAHDVVVGPYCIVGEHVILDAGVMLRSHVVVDGRTTIGAGTRIFPFASIGLEPQDLKYRGEESALVIGCNNRIREYVTMNRGTAGGGMITRVGDSCLFMVGVHVAHDCRIADHVIMANNATLAGQVMGDRARLCGLNIIGMQRRGFSREDIQGLRGAYQCLFSSDGTLSDRVNETAERFCGISPVDDILDFIRADSSRAICQPKGANDG